MIHLYATLSDTTKFFLSSINTIEHQRHLYTLHLAYSYTHSEYLLLKQSPLQHDLFANHISADLTGEVMQLANGTQLNNSDKIILIKNEKLGQLLKTFDVIDQIAGKYVQRTATAPSLIVDFLRLSYTNGYDLISASNLTWNYGD